MQEMSEHEQLLELTEGFKNVLFKFTGDQGKMTAEKLSIISQAIEIMTISFITATFNDNDHDERDFENQIKFLDIMYKSIKEKIMMLARH